MFCCVLLFNWQVNAAVKHFYSQWACERYLVHCTEGLERRVLSWQLSWFYYMPYPLNINGTNLDWHHSNIFWENLDFFINLHSGDCGVIIFSAKTCTSLEQDQTLQNSNCISLSFWKAFQSLKWFTYLTVTRALVEESMRTNVHVNAILMHN